MSCKQVCLAEAAAMSYTKHSISEILSQVTELEWGSKK